MQCAPDAGTQWKEGVNPQDPTLTRSDLSPIVSGIMPARNVRKLYIENGYYHLYNRGARGAPIFLDDRDYQVFQNLLKRYVAPELKIDPITSLQNPMNLSDSVDLISYCLMPNHFHFLIKQHEKDGITKFTRRVLTSYALYFNDKYEEKGNMFEGKLRGVLIDTDNYLLHLSRYIHRNPIPVLPRSDLLENYSYSSYPIYLGKRKCSWVKPESILTFFSQAQNYALRDINSYKNFVEQIETGSDEIVQGLTLE